MKYTPYFDQCCQILDAAAEYPNDVYLTASIRVQIFLARGLEASSYDDLDGSSAAMGMYVISLQKGLQKFKSSVLNGVGTIYTCKPYFPFNIWGKAYQTTHSKDQHRHPPHAFPQRRDKSPRNRSLRAT